MASAVAFRGFPLAGRVKELPPLLPATPGKPLASAVRLLNAKVDGDDDDDDSDASSVDGAAAYGFRRAIALADALNLLGEPSKMTQLMEVGGGAVPGTGFSFSATASGWWVSKEDDDSMQLKVAMPGLGKEHVKLTAEKNVLVIKLEGDKDPEDSGNKAPVVKMKTSRRILLPVDAFKMDQIKAEMNNGVLKVTLLKIKEEDRKDVFQIKIE